MSHQLMLHWTPRNKLQERAAPQVAAPKRPVPDFSDESASEEAGSPFMENKHTLTLTGLHQCDLWPIWGWVKMLPAATGTGA
jgi:hypothetical protein